MKFRNLLKAVLLVASITLPALAQAAITFTNLKGAVVLVNADGSETPLANDEKFADDAVLTVATGPDGFVTVITATGAINIEANSVVRITPNVVQIRQGVALVYGQGVEVSTGEANIVVNGESAVGSANGSSVVNVNEGTAAVTGTATGDTVTVNAGNSAIIPAGGTPAAVNGLSDLPVPPVSDISPVVEQTTSFMLTNPIDAETDPEQIAASPTGVQ